MIGILGLECRLGVVVQLVRISACHAEGRGFEPRPLRQYHTGYLGIPRFCFRPLPLL
ncbi:hypothetical protein CCP4SC76_7010007 [Gammaproteobacteria bacterium]